MSDVHEWDRVKRVFQGALDVPPEGRASYLRQTCRDDVQLRREVESLLAAHDAAGTFVDRPAIEALVASWATRHLDEAPRHPKALQTGLRLGPYRILSRLGRGGMGEVYRAHDARLDRTVAIKVLPSHLASDSDLKRRFEREARTLASLSHPHICPVFDVGSQDGIDYLVMEHLEGETLAQRLMDGPLPIAQAMTYSIQIADALDKAHRKGIVHRDLKPGNVMITKSGATLLDFGLAKQHPGSPFLDQAGTGPVSAPLTMEGAILGTLNYMAPEQVTGKDVDARTDIFAFGALVYEMITGARAFDGDSPGHVVAAILKSETPLLSARRQGILRALERVVARCLAKDPDARWQTATDLKQELQWIADEEDVTVSAPITSDWRRRGQLVALGLLIVAVIALSGFLLRSESRAEREAHTVRSIVATPDGVQLGGNISVARNLAISPDGTRVVYGATTLAGPLRLQSFEQLESEALQGTEGGSSPIFSPDGEWIAFFDRRESTLKKQSLLGGPITPIATTDGLLAGMSWGPDDTIVFATETGDGLYRVAASGDGQRQRLTTVAKGEGETSHRWPSVLPNGRAVLFTAWRGSVDASRIAFVSLDGGVVTYVGPGGTHPTYSPTGHIVYGAGQALRAVGFDARRLALTEDPTTVLEDVQLERNGAAQFDLAANGSLVYVQRMSGVAPQRTLVWVDREGREESFSSELRGYSTVRVSPDGQRIAAQILDGNRPEMWVSDASRAAWSKLPQQDVSSQGSAYQEWTPDGRRVVFQNAVGQLVWTAADGTGRIEQFLTVPGMVIVAPSGWTPDRRGLFFSYGTMTEIRNAVAPIATAADGSRPWRSVLDREGKGSGVRVSPTGGWAAYQSFDSGKYEVYVERYPEFIDRRKVSGDSGGFNPVWSSDGQELFYLGNGAMMAVRIRETPTFSHSAPEMLFPTSSYYPAGTSQAGGGGVRTWDVGADGRFLMIKASTRSQTLGAGAGGFVHVQNWFRELERLTRAN
jgi:serine/threonine protein kinase